MKKKLLVTGGAGFIGGNFIHYMMERYPEYKIFNLDALTYAGDLAKHRRLEGNPRYHFIQGDITDHSMMVSLFEKEEFDYVINFAAESHVDRSIADPGVFVRTNVLGTQVLLDAALKFGVAKFVQVSTDEVYGDLDFDPATFFTEDSPLQPNSLYSASKASADLMARAYNKTYGLPVNILRCSNNYGPYQFPEKLIPLTIAKAMNGKKVPVYGDGRNVRDWLHVRDHCAAIDLVLHKGMTGEVYNVGGHNERTNLEVVKLIIQSLDKPEDLIEFVSDRPGHDRRYGIDASKLEGLGWKPEYNFETGLKQTIQWYSANKWWWEPLVKK
ncbi:spore coat protein [Mesobacillus campisalis]|uniref:dTDP-glucose 4,6-dehydratase n=1 Tax=Mesobacillus campisalis TaxID=1408103 RepID=A0A0M2SZ03_9BACI|nr:dTDP-glucose 4,6-dehydratase [Mesobacillus campisalis]KKK38936.1 spore coat protein [Mesobacillus campisalis]